MQLKLKKFDMSKISDDRVVVFIGKRNTGKSFLVRDLLYYHRDLPIGTVISGTEGANRFYADMVPGLFIHDEFTPELVDKVLKRQMMVMKRVNKEKMLYGKSSLDPRAFLILDDCLHDATWARDKNIRYLFMNGRHQKVFFIVTMQYPLGVPPNLRTNIDYVFICRENNYQNRKRIYDCYAGMFPNFDVFCSVMDACTENYECLVIDNTCKSNKLQDQVYWYKADPHEPFTVCSREMWQIHNENINEGVDEEEEELFTPDAFKKKRSININVKKAY
jgi:hypothetical protein